MELNYDCVRECLLSIEKTQTNPTDFLQLDDLSIPAYSSNEIFYTLCKLQDAGFIDGTPKVWMGGGMDFFIKSITWSGHEFLNNIRDDNTYKAAKDKVKSTVGSVSLSVFAGVVLALVKERLGIQ